MKNRGFTLTEAIIAIAIIAIIFSLIFSALINNRAATERRATDLAGNFIAENDLSTQRVTCAGDSDGDGYGTCVVVTVSGEKIKLLCPTNWVDVTIWGVDQCKEDIVVFEGFGRQPPG